MTVLSTRYVERKSRRFHAVCCQVAPELRRQSRRWHGECVALVEAAAGTPRAVNWKGADVKGNTSIKVGTIIATFDKSGRYPNKSTGNHAAIYMGQNASGTQVNDQWHKQPPTSAPSISAKQARHPTMATSSAWSTSVLIALACLPAQAAGLSCPTDLHGARLTNFGIYDGDPTVEYPAQAAPDDESAKRFTYDVRREASQDPKGWRLVCQYAHGKLDLAIPASATSCKDLGTAFRPFVICQ